MNEELLKNRINELCDRNECYLRSIEDLTAIVKEQRAIIKANKDLILDTKDLADKFVEAERKTADKFYYEVVKVHKTYSLLIFIIGLFVGSLF